MKKKGSPNRAKGLKPEVKIITTHPKGKSVEKYMNILQERLETRRPNRSLEETFDISVESSHPERIISAVKYAGLQHETAKEKEEMLEMLGEESDYALVINKAAGELALFVEGETYPLQPVQYEKQLERH